MSGVDPSFTSGTLPVPTAHSQHPREQFPRAIAVMPGSATAVPVALIMAAEMIDRFGEPAAGGLVHVPLSVRELASMFGLASPGSMQSRLKELDGLGVRVDGKARLFDPVKLAGLLAVGETWSVRDVVQRAVDGNLSIDDAVALIERATNPTGETGPDPGTGPVAVTEIGVVRAAARADLMNESFIPSSVSSRDGSTRAGRSLDEMKRLVAPLLDAVAQFGGQGMSHPAGVRDAVEPFSDRQVERAVGLLCGEVRAGLRSGVGKLVNVAKAADPIYFHDEAEAEAELELEVPSDPSFAEVVGAPAAVELVTVSPGEVPERVATPEEQSSRRRAAEMARSLRSQIGDPGR